MALPPLPAGFSYVDEELDDDFQQPAEPPQAEFPALPEGFSYADDTPAASVTPALPKGFSYVEEPEPSPDFATAMQQGAKGLTDVKPRSTAVPFSNAEDRASGEAFGQLWETTAPGRAALAAYGRAMRNIPRSREEIDSFIDEIGSLYFSGDKSPQFRSSARKSIEYFASPAAELYEKQHGGKAQVSGLEVPEEVRVDRAEDSGLVTAGKEALLNVPGAASGLATAAAVHRTLPPTMHPLARLGIIIAAGAGGTYAGQSAAEAGYDLGDEYLQALGLDRQQRIINEQENPNWAFAGKVASGLIGGKPTLRGGLGLRAAEAGIGAGTEIASELAMGEDLDPFKIGISALANTAMGGTTPFSRALGFTDPVVSAASYRGVDRAEHITFDPPQVRAKLLSDLQTKSVDEALAGSGVQQTPEVRAAVEQIKAKIDSGDFVGAVNDAGNLPVTKNNGLDVDTATRYVNEATEGFANAPETVVHASPGADTVPAHLGAEEGTLGVYDKDSGTVHIFADQLVDQTDAQAVAYHEILGHAGLAWKYQDDLDNLLIGLYQKGNQNFKNAVDSWRQANPDSYSHIQDPNRRLAAQIEEVLAETSEQGPIQAAVLDRVKNYIKSVARKAGMDHLEFSDREIRSILATGHENIVNGADQAMGLGGVRYIYAGAGSATADYNKLLQATKMPQDTKQQQDITRRITGWHKGADEHWRYEISDHDFDFKPGAWEAMAADNQPRRAGDVFHHPELFKAYPELADIKVSVKPDRWDFDQLSQGWYSPETKSLVITPYAENPVGTAIHELQHAVQEIEGFSPGGNEKTALSNVSDEVALSAIEPMYEYVGRLAKPIRAKGEVFIASDTDPRLAPFREALDAQNTAWDAVIAAENAGRTPSEIETLRREWANAYDAAAEARTQLGRDFYGDVLTDQAKRDLYELENYMTAPPEFKEVELNKIFDDYNNLISIQDDFEAAYRTSDPDLARRTLAKVKGAGFQAYRNLHGEVEARDTALRLKMTPEGRQWIRPMTSEGEVSPKEYVFPELRGGVARETAPSKHEKLSVDDPAVKLTAEIFSIPEDRIPFAINERDFRQQVALTRIEMAKPPKPDADLNPADSVRAARRIRNPGFDKRTEDFLDKHLSPERADELHGWIKNLPKRDPVSDEQVIEKALDLGVDMEMVRKIGPMQDSSDLIVGIADFMNDKSRKVVEQANKLYDPDDPKRTKGTKADEIELIKQIIELGEVISMFDETRSNLGRMFRSLQTKIRDYGEDFNGIQDMLDEVELGDQSMLTSDNIREMARRIASGDIKQIRATIDKFDPDWLKFANSYYYNNLLGTLSVQEGNLLGNTFKLVQELGTDIAGAAVGSAKAALGSKSERVTWGEIGSRWVGLGNYLKTPETWRSVVRELTAPVGSAHKNKWQSQAHRNLPTSMALEGFVRMLQATDVFFRGATEATVINGLAVRRANADAQAQFGGKFGEHQDSEFVQNRVRELQKAPTKSMLSQAQQAGVDSVFQTNLGPITKALSGLRNLKPENTMTTLFHIIGRLSTPVVTAPVNIFKGAAELSMIPSVSRLVKNTKTGDMSPAQQDREVAKLLIGAATTFVAYQMAANAEMTGLGPSDPEERAEWLLSHKPQSLKIGDTWQSYKNLEPVATYLTIMADTIQEIQRGKKKAARKGNESWVTLVGNTMAAFGEAALSNAFISGYAENFSDGGNILEKLILGATTPVTRMPWISEATVLSDPYKRDVRGVDLIDKVIQRTKNTDPGLWTSGGRESLPVKIDGLGRPMPRVPVQETDPTALELGRLFDATGVVIAGAPSKAPRGIPIPSDVYNAHMLIVGPAVKASIEQVMKDPRYKEWNDEQKAQVLKRVASKTRGRYSKLLDQAMLARSPDYAKVMQSEIKRAFIEEEE